MADPFERHSRANGCCDDYSSQPSRSQQRRIAATEPQAKRPPGKKDPALCKAAHWKGPHQPELRAKEYGWHQAVWQRCIGCRWTLLWSVRGHRDVTGFDCIHEEVCAGCGKILRHRIPPRECPDFHEITEKERADVHAELERRAERAAAWEAQRKPKPFIAGPQGYRKKRSA